MTTNASRLIFMETLDEYNRRKLNQRQYFNAASPHPNGIACPQCGAELWDSDACIILLSDPPQRNVRCPSCMHVGYRAV